MSDDDDSALTWAGDEDLDRVERRPTATAARTDATDDETEPPGGRLGPVVAMLVIAALVETVLWVQSVFFGPLAGTLGAPDGTPVGTASFAVGLVLRLAGALAPLVWVAVVTRLVAEPPRRVAVLLLGVVLLVPWPALVRLL